MALSFPEMFQGTKRAIGVNENDEIGAYMV